MIEVVTLRDGGQSADEVAGRVVDFVARAEQSLDLALYDIDLREEPEQRIAQAIGEAHERGITVRIADPIVAYTVRAPATKARTRTTTMLGASSRMAG